MKSQKRNNLAIFANSILGSGIFFCLIIFLFTLRFPDLRLSGYIIVISLVGVVFLSIALRWSRSIKINISLAIISIGIGIFMSEIILSLYTSSEIDRIRQVKQQRFEEQVKKKGITYDTRSKYQVVTDFRKIGIDVYPLSPPAGYAHLDGLNNKKDKIFPLAFISGISYTDSNIASGEYIVYKSDEHGFNNNKGIFGESSIDIVLVGDSYTHGHAVKRHENIAGWLRKTGYTVLNLGMPGNGPLIELATLKEYAESIKPKTVFWLYCEMNDQRNLSNEMTSPILLKYLNEGFSQNLLYRQDQIDEALTAYIKKEEVKYEKKNDVYKKNNSKNIVTTIYKSVKLSNLRERLGLYRVGSINPLFGEILAKAKSRVNRWGGQLYFVYLPVRQRYDNEIKTDGNYMERETVLSVVKNLGIPIIDIHKVFSNYPDPLSLFPFRTKGHYTPEGYKLVSHHIDNYLQSQSNSIKTQSKTIETNQPLDKIKTP